MEDIANFEEVKAQMRERLETIRDTPNRCAAFPPLISVTMPARTLTSGPLTGHRTAQAHTLPLSSALAAACLLVYLSPAAGFVHCSRTASCRLHVAVITRVQLIMSTGSTIAVR